MLLLRSARDAECDPFASEVEALFKEARRRQRRRRERTIGAVLAALGGAALAGGISHGGRPTGTSRGAPRQVATAEVARSASVAARASVYVVHVAGPANVVVAGRSGVVATSDAGMHWRTITPSTISGILVSHIDDIASLGAARIWLEPVGDFRMDFVPYTDNGGARWSSGVLPGGAALSGSPLSFWTAENGRAAGGTNGGRLRVFQTDDGGASWKRVDGATPGPFGGPVSFTSASAGWTWTGGGLMYRTGDGGRTWQRVQLPAVRGYKLTAAGQPEVFDGGVVVVIAGLRSAGGITRTGFYESEDDGASWQAHLAPGASKRASGAVAINGSRWFALTGTELSSSTDAGTTWQEVDVRTPTGMSIDAIDYLSPTIGWAEAAGPPIGDLYPTYLLRTTDGGRDWSKVDFLP